MIEISTAIFSCTFSDSPYSPSLASSELDDDPPYIEKRQAAQDIDFCTCCTLKQLDYCCTQCRVQSSMPVLGTVHWSWIESRERQVKLHRIASRINQACNCCENAVLRPMVSVEGQKVRRGYTS